MNCRRTRRTDVHESIRQRLGFAWRDARPRTGASLNRAALRLIARRVDAPGDDAPRVNADELRLEPPAHPLPATLMRLAGSAGLDRAQAALLTCLAGGASAIYPKAHLP